MLLSNRQPRCRRSITTAPQYQGDIHGVDRVDLGVSSNNLAAIGCYKKVGFAQVGLWPSAIIAGSHNIDVVWMTMTRDRWNEFCGGKQ